MRVTERLLICALLLVAAGCTKPGIGVKADIQQQSFTAGVTSKADVVEAIGLPQHVDKDADGTEHFWYESSARLSGMCLGCGMASNTGGLIPAAAVASSRDRQRANAVEFIFTPDGILSGMNAPRKTARK